MNLWNDKVLHAMFAFAIGVVFTVMQLAASELNKILLVMGIVWCLLSLYFVVKAVKADWKE